MNNAMERVRSFHTAMTGTVNGTIGDPLDPGIHDPDIAVLRARLIIEEAAEAAEALVGGCAALKLWSEGAAKISADTEARSPADVATELADICVVTLGTAVTAGLPLPEVFQAVMDANDDKVRDEIRTRADGKILKPEDWRPPDIEAVIAAYQDRVLHEGID